MMRKIVSESSIFIEPFCLEKFLQYSFNQVHAVQEKIQRVGLQHRKVLTFLALQPVFVALDRFRDGQSA